MSCWPEVAAIGVLGYALHWEVRALKWMWRDTVDDIRWWRENGRIIDGQYVPSRRHSDGVEEGRTDG